MSHAPRGADPVAASVKRLRIFPERHEMGVLLCVFALLLLPILPTLGSLHYATDDYFLRSVPQFNSTDLGYNFAATGRPGQALLADLIYQLGASPPSGSVFSALMIAAFLYAGWVLCELWGVAGAPQRVLVATMHGAHPFYVELHSYSMVPFFAAVAMFTGFSGLLICPTSLEKAAWRRLALSGALFAVSLSVYQLFYAHFAIAILVLAAIRLACADEGESRHFTGFRRVTGELASRVVAMGAGLVGYLLLKQAYQAVTDAERWPQGQLLSPADFGSRLFELKAYLAAYLLRPSALQSGTFLLALLATLAVAAILLPIVRLAGAEQAKTAAVRGLAIVALLGLAFLLVPGISMASSLFRASPRIFSAVAVLVAGLSALSLANAGRARRAVLALAGIITFTYLATQGNAIIDQQRLNVQDQLMASQIFSELRASDQFHDRYRVAIIGGRWDFRQYGVRSVIGDLNVSAFVVEWAKLHVLHEVTGFPLQRATEADLVRAREAARSMPAWPKKGSVVFLGDLAVVKLSDPPPG